MSAIPGFQTRYADVRTSDGLNVMLLAPLIFIGQDGTVYTVPIGATSDGASTPRILWRELPPFGTYWLAAVFHDWLYRCSALDKNTCDSLFREAMESLGVHEGEYEVLYEGVHLCGWSSFTNDRKAQTPAA